MLANKVRSIVIAALVAAVWGYFADLRAGQYGWFVGRIIAVVAIAWVLEGLVGSRRRPTSGGSAR